MLSLRSLAFNLCSAIRRARALSCSALHSFPDRTKTLIIEQKMATIIEQKIATNRDASMSVSNQQFSPKTQSTQL